MKKERRLLELIGTAADEYILEAEQWGNVKAQVVNGHVAKLQAVDGKNGKRFAGKKARPYWHICGAAAATLVLVTGVFALSMNSLRMGSGDTGNNGTGNELAAGGTGCEPSEGCVGNEDRNYTYTFMNYEGPVFPLTIGDEEGSSENISGITATRDITWDYQYMDGESSYMKVTDSYELTNSSDQDMTVMAYYPYEENIRELFGTRPSVTVDGQKQNTEIEIGAYFGGCMGVVLEENADWKASATEIGSWEGYQELLADGVYLQQAIQEPEELNQPVTVYEFSDFEAPLDEYDAATQAISFYIDVDATQILSYGFNGLSMDNETGYRCYDYFVPGGNKSRKEKKVLIALGQDIEDYELTGYKNGACEAGNELDEVSCTVTRRETTLGQVVEECLTDYLLGCSEDYGEEAAEAMELLGLMAVRKAMNTFMEPSYKAWLIDSGVMLDEMLMESMHRDRVLYEAFPVTIPTGSSVTVTAVMKKEPSYDYYGSGSPSVGISGYDMVTQLGSGLEFTDITARIRGMEKLEIVSQNFGFDWEQDVTELKLDMTQEHYHMECGEKP